MENFDLKSMKNTGILLAICAVFVLLVANAYKYLPDNMPADNTAVQTETQIQTDDDDSDSQDEDSSDNAENSDSSPDTDSAEPEPLEVIQDESLTSNTKTSDESPFDLANKYFIQKDYNNALNSYHAAAESTDDVVLKAECYEKIATIYGIYKKYGTALAFAQKGYNLAPSTSREVLLGRLYYKTGYTDKAIERLNNILKRDFSADFR